MKHRIPNPYKVTGEVTLQKINFCLVLCFSRNNNSEWCTQWWQQQPWIAAAVCEGCQWASKASKRATRPWGDAQSLLQQVSRKGKTHFVQHFYTPTVAVERKRNRPVDMLHKGAMAANVYELGQCNVPWHPVQVPDPNWKALLQFQVALHPAITLHTVSHL